MADEIRNYANHVLQSISQATLTDEEAILLPEVNQANLILEALAKVMNQRGATGNGFKKLRAFATLYGIEIGTKQNKRSDILIGMVIE
jgi:hypothetical protein